jgi:hypothetical protein
MRNDPMEGVMSEQALRVIDSVASELPPLSLQLPDALPFEDWVAIGRKLCAGQQALNWHIGDWWAFGDHRYGDRAKLAAEGIFGREFQSLIDMATVARRFETTRRRVDLSFTHHREAAALPPEEADAILDRAEQECWSTREVRREVQAVRVANDPAPARVHSAPPPPPPPVHSAHRELTVAYGQFVEAMESLQEYRDLTKRENDFLAVALEYLNRGNDSRRRCPDDFDIIFVEKGRIECESWFRASRLTVNRWLLERGKKRLIDSRAAFVRHMRDQEYRQADEQPIEQVVDPLLSVARLAADFLRVSRYGGWIITQCPTGGWRVGTVHKTSDQVIAMAERQGFDPTGLIEE